MTTCTDRITLAALLTLAVALVMAAPGSTAAAVDVSEVRVANPPKRLVEGRSYAVSDTSRTRGGSVRRARVRYYLSADRRRSLGDLRLRGGRGLAGRRAGASAVARVTVPHSIPGGPFHLLACADDTRLLHEANERNNCATSAGTARVRSSGRDAGTRIQAFSDLTLLPPDNGILLTTIAGLGRLRCPQRTGGGQPGVGTALDRLQAMLTHESRAGVASFRRSREFRSATAVEAGAADGLTSGSPAASLQALLRAHELEPGQSRHLVNAASIAASLGKPLEALSLLARADRLEPSASIPFGVNTQAVSLNAQGFALLQLGRLPEAEKALEAAVGIEPLLSEAKVNLAVARICAGDKLRGQRILRAGQYRQARYDDTLDPEEPFDPPAPADVLDLSGGKPGGLAGFALPATIDQATAWSGIGTNFYGGILADLRRRADARGRRRAEGAAWNQAHPPAPGTKSFVLNFHGGLVSAPLSPGIKPLHARVVSYSSEFSELHNFWSPTRADGFPKWQSEAFEACEGSSDPTCYKRELWDRCRGPSADAHASWLRIMGARVAAVDAYLRAYYPRATAYAAHISEAGPHAWMMDEIESHVDLWLHGLAFEASIWAGHTIKCARPEDSGPPPQNPIPNLGTPEKCPPWLRAVRIKLKLALAEVEVNCEKVKLELSGRLAGSKDNWIGAFGEVEYNTHTGKVTVFGGPKASGKIPGTPFGGSVKDGLYIRFGSDGSVDDVGMRVKGEGSASWDPVTIKGGDSMDFSFVPVFGGS